MGLLPDNYSIIVNSVTLKNLQSINVLCFGDEGESFESWLMLKLGREELCWKVYR
jgi:hypothetical protein